MKAEVKRSDVIVNLELSEVELNTIVAHFGVTSTAKAVEIAYEKNMEVLNRDSIQVLYKQLNAFVESLKESK